MSHSGWSTSNYISALAGSIPTAVPLTIHVRYKPASSGSSAYVVGLSDGTTTNEFFLRVNAGGAPVAGTSAASTVAATGATSLSSGTWYSLVARFSAINSRLIYVGGVQDGSNTSSRTPTGISNARVGVRGNVSGAALGSLAEVAIWNVALSADDIAALATVSPLLIRPDVLVCYIPLLDSGTLDLVAPAATVTGTLTKDNDHPRVILPRQRSLIIPKSAGGGATAYTATLDPATFAYTGSSLTAVTGRNAVLDPSSFALTGQNLTAVTGRNAVLSPASFLYSGQDLDAVYVDNGVAVDYTAELSPASFSFQGMALDVVATGQSTVDTHDGIGYGDPFRRKRRPKKGKREKAVEDLLKKLMGLIPDDPPPAIEAEAEIAQASVERLFAPTVDVTPNLEALQFAQLQLAKLEAMLNRYLEDEDDEDDLLLMAA